MGFAKFLWEFLFLSILHYPQYKGQATNISPLCLSSTPQIFLWFSAFFFIWQSNLIIKKQCMKELASKTYHISLQFCHLILTNTCTSPRAHRQMVYAWGNKKSMWRARKCCIWNDLIFTKTLWRGREKTRWTIKKFKKGKELRRLTFFLCLETN